MAVPTRWNYCTRCGRYHDSESRADRCEESGGRVSLAGVAILALLILACVAVLAVMWRFVPLTGR